MTLSLQGLTVDYGDAVYYYDGFRAVFEDHIELFRNDPTTRSIDVTAEDAYMYEYRPHVYFTNLGYAWYLHWYILRLNYLSHPSEFTADIRKLYVPTPAQLSTLASNYQTTFAST